MSRHSNRRKFIHGLAGCAMTSHFVSGWSQLANISTPLREFNIERCDYNYSANDKIQVALIGAGGMGLANANTSIEIPGVKLIAVCDLYDDRLSNSKRIYGNDIFVTKDYREILQRKDVDAVIVATPDHWHKDISIAAMNVGKSVYCEKPMIHNIGEGAEVVEAQRKSGVVFEVGSQGVSSLGNEKAKELLAAGAIGKLNYAEGYWARNSPEGAWQYSIPSNANEKTVDWRTFLNKYSDRSFDAKRFFRWRCYKDYGTGVSGDLFVHLFSSLHFITNSIGPSKIMAMGGLRYWKDGREVPDLLMGMFDYDETTEHPAFNVSLRVNFVDGTAESTYLRLVGSEGSMIVEWDRVILTRNKGIISNDDPLAKTKLGKNNPMEYERKKMLPPESTVYKAQEGYRGAHFDHFYNFFSGIRHKKPIVEDALFGYRAAAPALLCNDSYFQNKPIIWDPQNLKVIS